MLLKIAERNIIRFLDIGIGYHAQGDDRFFVVMTVQSGKYPKIKSSGKELDSGVKVGNQTIHFKDNQIIFN